MKCTNSIIEIKWKNGKSQILSKGTVTYEWLNKINGTFTESICDGDIACHIFGDSEPEFYEGDIAIKFSCDRCGKEYKLPYTVEDIEKLVSKII